MIKTRIQQKDSQAHTIFNVGTGGLVFPESNYLIAKGWMDAGLLDEESYVLMRWIGEEKAKRKEG